MQYNSLNLQSLEKKDKGRLLAEIALMCYDFLKINSTGEANDLVSRQFSEDIIASRKDWKLPEIKLFFDTIRRRQDIEAFKIIGYRITPLKLMEMVCAYEELRSEAREGLLKQSKATEPTEKLNIASMEEAKVYIDKIFENVKPIKKVCQPTEKNSAYWIVQEYLEEFDRLFNSQQNTCEGVRYVVIQGVKYDIDKYLRLRMEYNEIGDVN